MDSATVDFALTRFEAVDGVRLEVEGTWSGVRGVRFVRPALVVRDRAGGGEKTLLAHLEHKPWPAEDGRPWVASFPWKGGDEPDVARIELAVAPSIVVPLVRAAAGDAVAVAAELDPVDALRAELAETTERARRLEAEVAFLRREREEVEGVRRERDAVTAERDRARDAAAAKPDREAIRAELRQRDDARAARDEAVAARDAAIAEREELRTERDALRRELRDRDQIAEGAARRREQALEERDAARRQLEAAEERVAERERVRASARIDEMAGTLAAVEAERDRALAEPAGVVAPRVRRPREHATESAHADWAARTAAIVAVLVLLILAVTFFRALG
jgi:hypothetical protein